MTRRRGDRPTISLFPFLSILVCLMGVLAFITVAVALLSAANPTVTLTRTTADNGFTEGASKQPIFVECHGDRLLIHPQGEEAGVAEMASAASPFVRLIDRLQANRDREYVIFAVYPDGIPCFKEGRTLAEQRGVDLGFEPMLEGWRLRLAEPGGTAP